MLGVRLVASLGSTRCPQIRPGTLPSPRARGPATEPCSIIPRDAPGLQLPRKLLANGGAGARGALTVPLYPSPSLGCCIRGAKRVISLLIPINLSCHGQGWSWVSPARHGVTVGLPGLTWAREKEKERESWQEPAEAGEAPAAGRGSQILWPQCGRRSVAAAGTVLGSAGQPQAAGRSVPMGCRLWHARDRAGALAARQPAPCSTRSPGTWSGA